MSLNTTVIKNFLEESEMLGKVVMTGRTRPVADQWVRQHCEVKSWNESGTMPRELLLEWIRDAEGLLSVGIQAVKVDAELLANAPKLRVVAQSMVGYDNIDVAACTARGIPVGNTPGVLTEATADLAFLLLLAAARRLKESFMLVQQGQWTLSAAIPLGLDLYGKTLGIVGMGQIGAAVARRAQACGMKILYHNRRRRQPQEEQGAEYAGFEELLAQADFVMVLTPLSEASRGLFNRQTFSRMKKTALFINAARGPVVDTDALVEALQNGWIGGCALDVTDPEPIPADHPLLAMPNVFITPHIGSATQETRDSMAMLAVENLMLGLEQKPLKTCVNPQVYG